MKTKEKRSYRRRRRQDGGCGGHFVRDLGDDAGVAFGSDWRLTGHVLSADAADVVTISMRLANFCARLFTVSLWSGAVVCAE